MPAAKEPVEKAEEKPKKSAKKEKAAAEPEPVEEVPEEPEEEENNETARFSKIYSNVASNKYENLRTSYIENKAKELRKKRK